MNVGRCLGKDLTSQAFCLPLPRVPTGVKVAALSLLVLSVQLVIADECRPPRLPNTCFSTKNYDDPINCGETFQDLCLIRASCSPHEYAKFWEYEDNIIYFQSKCDLSKFNLMNVEGILDFPEEGIPALEECVITYEQCEIQRKQAIGNKENVPSFTEFCCKLILGNCPFLSSDSDVLKKRDVKNHPTLAEALLKKIFG